jgi:hypothetical protein
MRYQNSVCSPSALPSCCDAIPISQYTTGMISVRRSRPAMANMASGVPRGLRRHRAVHRITPTTQTSTAGSRTR